MSAAQWAGVAVCCGLMAVDGYDTLAITLALPGIGAAWATTKVLLGAVVSLGLIGMAIGSLLLGPFADILGRRPVVFGSLGLTFVGMALSALAPNVGLLMAWRLTTGIGMGALVAVAYPLAAEYSSLRTRPITLALMAMAFPLGGVIGGTVAAQIMPAFGWRSAFVPGIMFPVLVAIAALRWLPESLGVLIERPGVRSLASANRYLVRVGLPPTKRLPAPAPTRQIPLRRVLGPEFRASTLYLSAIFCLYSCTAYFLLAWVPQIVAGLGFTPAVAATVAVAINVGGMIGAAATGVAIRWAGAFLGLLGVLLGLGVTVLAFGLAPADLTVLRGLGLLAGVCLWGPIVGINVLVAEEFPVEVRGTGNGFVVGSSRWVAAAGPLIGGFLFSLGLGVAGSCAVAAAICVVAAGLLVRFHLRYRRGHADASRPPPRPGWRAPPP